MGTGTREGSGERQTEQSTVENGRREKSMAAGFAQRRVGSAAQELLDRVLQRDIISKCIKYAEAEPSLCFFESTDPACNSTLCNAVEIM